MSFIEYDGLSVEKAVAKLLAKSFHDEEDKAFARARASYLSPEELASILGEEVVASPKEDEDGKPAVVGGEEGNAPEGDVMPEGFISEKEMAKLTSDELQAIALEKGLDTSGTKKELTARINAFVTEAKTE